VAIQIVFRLTGPALLAFFIVHEVHSEDAGLICDPIDFRDVVDELYQRIFPLSIFLANHGIGIVYPSIQQLAKQALRNVH